MVFLLESAITISWPTALEIGNCFSGFFCSFASAASTAASSAANMDFSWELYSFSFFSLTLLTVASGRSLGVSWEVLLDSPASLGLNVPFGFLTFSLYPVNGINAPLKDAEGTELVLPNDPIIIGSWPSSPSKKNPSTTSPGLIFGVVA